VAQGLGRPSGDGVAVLLAGRYDGLRALQSSLKRIWKVEERTQASVLWVLVKERLLSLAMVLAVGFCSWSPSLSALRWRPSARPRSAGSATLGSPYGPPGRWWS